MAYTRLTAQQIVNTGLAPTYAAAASAGNDFANDGRVFLHVKNTSGNDITVTIATPRKVDGLDVAEDTVSVVKTTGEKFIGPFSPETFNQVGGLVYVTYSAVTNVSVALFRL